MIQRYFLLCAWSISVSPLFAQQTSVLFIGNSYTYVNDLPNTVRLLALSLGDTVNVASSTPGGYTYEGHTTLPATLDAIASQTWDFVALQEQSQLGALPFDVTTTEASATQLVDLIRANDECTMPVFYMTWGRQNGDAGNCASFPFMCTYDGMQQGLTENYTALAEGSDAYTAPVGAAWKQVRDTHPLINLYQADASHPSAEGTYLAACVFYCTLFQQSCVPSIYAASVQPDTAAILRAIADEVVLNDLTAWNLDVLPPVDATITGSSSNAWNEVTYYHGGASTHLWTCTNGQEFTTPDASFTFSVAGVYTITHAYTNPCGESDTVTWTVEVYSVGVGEGLTRRSIQVLARAGSVEVRGAEGLQLILHDAMGRTVLDERMNSTLEMRPCGNGPYFWSAGSRGTEWYCGKVLVLSE